MTDTKTDNQNRTMETPEKKELTPSEAIQAQQNDIAKRLKEIEEECKLLKWKQKKLDKALKVLGE